MRVNGTLYYTLKDHLGSASVVTDSTGAIVGEQRYYPFGETRLTTGSMFTDKLFTGQREMTGLGIYHYGARFYSPKLGRFLSADTMVPNPANPQDFNCYSYVRNNPIRFTDPSGNIPIDCYNDPSYCSNTTTLPTSPYPSRPVLPGAGGGGDAPPITDSTIRIGFGSLNDDGQPEGQNGLGTVVGDSSTIVTAAHVYLPDSPYMFYRDGENGEELTIIDMNDVTLDFSEGGDILVVSLPEDLPGSFIPATPAPDHIFLPSQNVTLAYQDESRNLHALVTQLTWIPYTFRDDWSLNIVVLNTNGTLTSGDSGGGVFYNGEFVGVASALFSQFGEDLMAFQPYR